MIMTWERTYLFILAGHKCPFYIKDGLGVVESPNFPGEYPAGAECHWRVRPGRNKRVLVIISNIQLGEECGDVLTIRRTGEMNTAGQVLRRN